MANKVVQLVDKNSNNLYPIAGSVITDAVSTTAISNQAVTNPKIENGAVNGVANDATAIGTAKLALDTVGTPNLRDASVTSDKIDWTTMPFWPTMPFSDIEFGIDNTTSGASSITFSRSHSTAPDAILCTMISVNNENISIDATVYNVTATGFRVKKSWMSNSSGGPASEPYYWLALWH